MWNKKRVVLRTTAPSIGCTVKGILFFLRLLRNYIVYWAGEIVAVHILHTISPQYLVVISRVHIHTLYVRLYVISPYGQLFKYSGPCHGFPERRNPTHYIFYNSEFEDTLYILYTIYFILYTILSFSLLDWPPLPHSMLIIGWWCSKPRTEAIGTLGSVPLLC